jgi:ribonuclease HII
MSLTLGAGVDEAGRGSLAGAVFAAAVILDPNRPIEGLKDSKLIPPKKREILAQYIKEKALSFAIAKASVEEVDTINVFQASLLAMRRAIEMLSVKPTLVWVDGLHCPDIDITAEAIVKGDQLIPAISAASILAKTARDAEMLEYDKQYPEYAFAIHKGYGTQKHRALIKKFGRCAIHRKSFRMITE